MARDWKNTFIFWGAPPSKTESERCGNAERAVRKAIAASETLSALDVEAFVQGSYANGTNVRQDSDVDICVLYKPAFFTNYGHTPDLNNDVLGYTNGTYKYATFKNDVEAAMVSYFGKAGVRRGNKAFDIHENTYRVDADVVPCFQHRLFAGDRSHNWYLTGTELHPDSGGRIVNWPKQNHDNGNQKDVGARGEFKAVTRVLKNLRFELIDEGEAIADKIPSYLIECLVYKVPVEHLSYATRYDNVRNAIAWLWEQTCTDDLCGKWTEVNDIKFLLHASQPWKREDVNTFLQTAWKYIGFE